MDVMARLVSIREDRKIPQLTVAKRMGWGQSSISKLEKKLAKNIRVGDLQRYAEALGVAVTVEIDDPA